MNARKLQFILEKFGTRQDYTLSEVWEIACLFETINETVSLKIPKSGYSLFNETGGKINAIDEDDDSENNKSNDSTSEDDLEEMICYMSNLNNEEKYQFAKQNFTRNSNWKKKNTNWKKDNWKKGLWKKRKYEDRKSRKRKDNDKEEKKGKDGEKGKERMKKRKGTERRERKYNRRQINTIQESKDEDQEVNGYATEDQESTSDTQSSKEEESSEEEQINCFFTDETESENEMEQTIATVEEIETIPDLVTDSDSENDENSSKSENTSCNESDEEYLGDLGIQTMLTKGKEKNNVEYKRPKGKYKIPVDPNLFKRQKRNNAIEVSLRNNNVEVNTKLLLDSGNTCFYSSMSNEFYLKLKKHGLLDGAKIFSSNASITGANSEKFGVKFLIKKKLRFYTKCNSYFDISDFYVINGLTSDINISKTAMSVLNITWQFKDDYLVINKIKIPLISCNNSTGLLRMIELKPCKVQGIPKMLFVDIVKSDCIRLYPESPTEIPPNSSMQIRLIKGKKQNEELNSNKDLIIIPKSSTFREKGLVATKMAICRNDYLTLNVMNVYSSTVKIYKQDVIAYGYRCNNEIQSYFDELLVNSVDREVKEGIRDKQEEMLNALLLAKDEMNFADEEICEMRDDKHSPKVEMKYQDNFDKLHFSLPMKEKREYISRNFQLNENTLLSKKEKEKIVDLFVKYWKVLDITGKRLPTIKQGIIPPHKIETFGIPQKAKCRPLNPELSKKLKTYCWNGRSKESLGNPPVRLIRMPSSLSVKKMEVFGSV